ncbi:MAG TPA: flavin reductase family protein [Gemmatimonadales bacterium]|jgi:flavin reductase (DIM6/NTAB) family NADH-FMN oxidoreductase RutF|nr:flavin reductase family protein [Gemmatimonadales bacterium]
MPTNFDVAPSLFRQLMGRFATGVTVITATHPDTGAPRGMTASSVASVSLTPPLLSVCVEKEAALHGLFILSPIFAVNVLAEDQEELSRRFAGPQVASFDGVGYHTSERGLILLDGAVAHIECQRVGAHAAGDHTILLGGVIGGAAHDARPLLYFRGGYASLG